VNIYIMAIPSRAAIWRQLVSELQAQGATVQVIVDHECSGPLHTFKRCLRQALEDGQPQFVVLQDDVWVADDAVLHMERIADLRHEGPICLFAMTSKRRVASLDDARAANTAWASVRYSSWGQGFVLTSTLALRLLAFAECILPTVRWSDTFVTWYCQEHRTPILVALPNLIEHGRAPSSLGHIGTRPSVYYRQKIGEDHQWDSIERAIRWQGSPIAQRAQYMRAVP
jgi:hypothetical protein